MFNTEPYYLFYLSQMNSLAMYLNLDPSDVMLLHWETMKISRFERVGLVFLFSRGLNAQKWSQSFDSARWQAFSSVSELYLVLHGVSDRAELVSIETFVHLECGGVKAEIFIHNPINIETIFVVCFPLFCKVYILKDKYWQKFLFHIWWLSLNLVSNRFILQMRRTNVLKKFVMLNSD